MTDIYLPGAASIIEQIDTRLLIVLRDGRNLIGTLRSFDQYLNLVLEDTVERVYFEDLYAEISVGLFLLRGDNVVIFGEYDEEQQKQYQLTLNRVSLEELKARKKSKEEAKGVPPTAENVEWDLE
eukprot:gene6297-6776_t